MFEAKFPASSKAIEANLEPKNFKKWSTKTLKGGFYYNEAINGIISNSYAFDLHSDANIYFTIETYKTPLHSDTDVLNMDVALLIVKNNKSLTLKGLTESKIKNVSLSINFC